MLRAEPQTNASFELVNAALQAGATVSLAQDAVKTANGTETGAFLISGITRDKLDGIAKKYAVGAVAVSAPAHTWRSRRRRSDCIGRGRRRSMRDGRGGFSRITASSRRACTTRDIRSAGSAQPL